MRLMTIDGRLMTSKEALYGHLSRIFSFPNHFGNNLDALWDILNEADEPTQIHFVHVEEAAEQLGEYGERLIELLKELDEQNSNFTVRFD